MFLFTPCTTCFYCHVSLDLSVSLCVPFALSTCCRLAFLRFSHATYLMLFSLYALSCFPAFRYMGFNGQPAALCTWRSVAEAPRQSQLENGFSDPAVTPDEPKSEPLPDTPSLLPADSNGLSKSILQRQQSLVILTGRVRTTALKSLLHGYNLLRLRFHPKGR